METSNIVNTTVGVSAMRGPKGSSHTRHQSSINSNSNGDSNSNNSSITNSQDNQSANDVLLSSYITDLGAKAHVLLNRQSFVIVAYIRSAAEKVACH
mmetsp:Transcript_16977/g.46999  ORF Transcript_16977/g.46999 Transcript_16977/m.46999 type:complete len:97 (-) Transcript_16977:1298-1588(-)